MCEMKRMNEDTAECRYQTACLSTVGLESILQVNSTLVGLVGGRVRTESLRWSFSDLLVTGPDQMDFSDDPKIGRHRGKDERQPGFICAAASLLLHLPCPALPSVA